MLSDPNLLRDLKRGIEPLSPEWHAAALARLDTLTKPLGSLGRLETIAAQWVAMRREQWADPVRKGVYVFAADHGVTSEGVSAYPSDVTQQMVLNFLNAGAAVNVLARQHGAELTVIDTGVEGDFGEAQGLIHRKVARGTANLRRGAAMTCDQLSQALAAGAEMADRAAARQQNLIAIGEMGIGNTTSASAITCALTGLPAAEVTGRGTGIAPDVFQRKVQVVDEAVQHHFAATAPDPLEVLRCVGGFEIATMCGMMLRAACHRIAIVVDGFICTAAAALAAAIAPDACGYMIAGHRSQEPGHRLLLERLGLLPVLALDMRLGEASGAVLAMPVIESAIALYREMATFGSAGVSEASGSEAGVSEASA